MSVFMRRVARSFLKKNFTLWTLIRSIVGLKRLDQKKRARDFTDRERAANNRKKRYGLSLSLLGKEREKQLSITNINDTNNTRTIFVLLLERIRFFLFHLVFLSRRSRRRLAAAARRGRFLRRLDGSDDHFGRFFRLTVEALFPEIQSLSSGEADCLGRGEQHRVRRRRRHCFFKIRRV